MKKVMRIVGVVLCICLIVGVGYIVSRKLKKYPENVEYGQTEAITDKGMYYFHNKQLLFLDANTKKSAVVCNKANCKHNTKDCNAYINGQGPKIFSYGNKLYMSLFSSQIEHNEEDDSFTYEATAQIKEIDQDGNNSRIIYSADEGAVSSMQMIDGVLYFCAWTYHGGFVINEYHLDYKLYAYDLRWNRLKVLSSYIADAEHDNADLELIKSDRKDRVFLNYSYTDSAEMRKNEIWTYDIDTGAFSLIQSDSSNDYKMAVIGDTFYISEVESAGEEEWMAVYASNLDLTEKKELLTVKSGTINYLNGYMYLFNSAYNKFLYKYDTGDIYWGNTCFTESGTYISDVLDIDEANDQIYIDAHDYTGMEEGDVYTVDVSEFTSVSWSDFLNKNYTKLEDADQAAVAAFDWVKWPEDF